jgi:hypothetical protein
MRCVLLAVLSLGVGACGDDGASDCACDAIGCFADGCTKTVFLSREAVPANFGGVAAADQTCAAEAAAAGLPGTFYAWLSDPTTSPFKRFSKSEVPYVLPDGTQVAADWAALTSTGTSATISVFADMTKAPADEGDSAQQVWSGTSIDGRADTYNNASNYCSNWSRNVIEDSVLIGWVNKRNDAGDWTLADLVQCTGTGRVYCFQQ